MAAVGRQTVLWVRQVGPESELARSRLKGSTPLPRSPRPPPLFMDGRTQVQRGRGELTMSYYLIISSIQLPHRGWALDSEPEVRREGAAVSCGP